MTVKTRAKVDIMTRFMRHVFVNESKVFQGTPCHDWTGWAISTGHGMFMDEDWKDGPAMRWIYERTFGPLGSLVTDHLCRRPVCVNPYHAEDVTQQENNRRGIGWPGLNYRKTHCPRGHEYTPENIRRPAHCPEGRSCRKCAAIRQREYIARKQKKVAL